MCSKHRQNIDEDSFRWLGPTPIQIITESEHMNSVLNKVYEGENYVTQQNLEIDKLKFNFKLALILQHLSVSSILNNHIKIKFKTSLSNRWKFLHNETFSLRMQGFYEHCLNVGMGRKFSLILIFNSHSNFRRRGNHHSPTLWYPTFLQDLKNIYFIFTFL